MPGIKGAPLGAPSQAEPLGQAEHAPTTAPIAAHAGLGLGAKIEDREEDATERFFAGSEVDDEPDDGPTWTSRHTRPF